MSSLIAGPYCGQVLADLGAEVIKIEAPGSDLMRLAEPSHRGHAAHFEQNNRGKKSVVVNLKTEEGRQAVRKLANTADVFLQNSRPGVMERLGLGYEDLRQANSKLIYLSISGFGEIGPYAGLPAYDPVIQGLTGFMPIQGGAGKPKAILSPVADKITAIWASHAALAALLHRERTGEGQKIVVSMLKSFAAFMLPDPMSGHTFQSVPPTESSIRFGMFESLETADGHVIGLIQQRKHFEGLCTVLGREDLLDDPRFATDLLLRDNVGPLYTEIGNETRKMSTAAFLKLMSELSVPFGKVNSIEDFFEDPQVKASEVYVDVADPELGVIRHLNYPAVFERSPAKVRRRAPKLGEHTDEILGVANPSRES